MRFNDLKSIGHNISDSLASGLCFPLGLFLTAIFDEAAVAPEGQITVDFLAGATGGEVSEGLAEAVRQYRGALEVLCEKHGVPITAFRVLKTRYGTDRVHGAHFTVMVEDSAGRSSVDTYEGWGGRRMTKGRSIA